MVFANAAPLGHGPVGEAVVLGCSETIVSLEQMLGEHTCRS